MTLLTVFPEPPKLITLLAEKVRMLPVVGTRNAAAATRGSVIVGLLFVYKLRCVNLSDE